MGMFLRTSGPAEMARGAHHFGALDRPTDMGHPALVTIDHAELDKLRPELHRYCARMTGSVVEGEDLVQDTLVEALTSAPTGDPARLRAWAFRTAHNRAIDRWRSYDRRMREPFDSVVEAGDPSPRADDLLAGEEAVHAALSRFVALPTLQRSCVILKDVLDLSLEEIAALLDTTVSAVQAALHRGRRSLREHSDSSDAPTISPDLARYAALFSARDWDGVRAMLADDVRLDVIGRFKKRGRDEVGSYFGNYDRLTDWTAEPKLLDGREVLAVSRHGTLAHVIVVALDADRVTAIRDYFHVPYMLNDARFA
jgi:RNA polymerase sigma-70 factor (ECF subfamily)